MMPYVDLLATSPLTRCVETAQIISGAYNGLEILEAPVLAPGRTPEKVTAWLKTQKKHGVIAIVGHEPDLDAAPRPTACTAGTGIKTPLLLGDPL